MSGSEPIRLTVPEEAKGQRIDAYLAAQLADHSRSRISSWIRAGLVVVDDRIVLPRYRVDIGDEITVAVPEPPPAQLEPQEMDLNVIFEDEHVIVVDKPAGLVVHPGAGNPNGTLVNGLLHRYGNLSPIGAPDRPGIVHRIDAGTSGLLVVARTEIAHNGLARQFSDHSASRVYNALVWDHGLQDEGTHDTLYGRHPGDRRKFTTLVKQGKHAVTHWKVKRRLGPCAWVELRLETGRTHQIRVHFGEDGCPLLGDPVYGRKRKIERVTRLRVLGWDLGLKRQALHAAQLGFVHPVTGKALSLDSSVPDDIARVLEALETPS